MNSANKVIICFLGFDYLIPLFFHNLVATPTYAFINGVNFKTKLYSFIISSLTACFLFNKKIAAQHKQLKIKKPLPLLILALNLTVALVYFSNNLFGSRYIGGISNLPNFNLLTILSQICYEIASIDILLIIWTFLLLKTDDKVFTKRLSLQSVLFISGLNSALSFLYPISASIITRTKTNLVNQKNTFSLKRFIKILFLSFAFLAFGLIVKNRSLESNDITNYFSISYLIDRFSTHMYHFSSVCNIRNLNFQSEIETIKIIFISNIADRLNMLLYGIKIHKEDYQKSISGFFNFYFFNDELGAPPPGGSSIGLFATITLIFPFPFDLFVNLSFFVVLKLILVRLFANKQLCSWPMACAFAYGPLRIILDDPLGCFNPFEPVLLSFLIFFIFICKGFKKN